MCHHDSKKGRRRYAFSSTAESQRGQVNRETLRFLSNLIRNTPLFLIFRPRRYRTHKDGGGRGRGRGIPQSPPDIRETERLFQRHTDGLQPAHLCGFTVGGEPGVVGLRLQLVRGAARTEKTEAHTLESRRESPSQVSVTVKTPCFGYHKMRGKR